MTKKVILFALNCVLNFSDAVTAAYNAAHGTTYSVAEMWTRPNEYEQAAIKFRDAEAVQPTEADVASFLIDLADREYSIVIIVDFAWTRENNTVFRALDRCNIAHNTVKFGTKENVPALYKHAACVFEDNPAWVALYCLHGMRVYVPSRTSLPVDFASNPPIVRYARMSSCRLPRKKLVRQTCKYCHVKIEAPEWGCDSTTLDCTGDNGIATLDEQFAQALATPIAHCHSLDAFDEQNREWCAWCTLDKKSALFKALWAKCTAGPTPKSKRRCPFLFRRGRNSDSTSFLCYLHANGKVEIRMKFVGGGAMVADMLGAYVPPVQDFIVPENS